ncbi:glycoside hydrolase family 79 protein [Thelephora ganbajun]|uniref:Glycoside hydrolase family 79 protein n=1 Tax=Thelephora ganbajun TaxID=370292 RepID=A0ACB6Z8H5_THEGA|nr:glycoside hydrolase family 79 protein [Thelephora ganbajun]
MHFSRGLLPSVFILTLFSVEVFAIQVVVPSAPRGGTFVHGNFLGISFELSFLDKYFGSDVNSIPTPFLNYLKVYEAYLPSIPLRLRIGGNSVDISTYVKSQTQFLNVTDPGAQKDHIPVTFGPTLLNVMSKVGKDIGGAEYLMGLSLSKPNDTTIAELAVAAHQILGDELDALLLGNEPDLYYWNGKRPGLSNYTVDDYVGDYQVVFNQLKSTSNGDVLAQNNIGGPTICCAWDLATTLQQSYLETFKQQLKYITLQHYPQNNCPDSHSPPPVLEYYLDHSNTVNLAKWQKPGVDLAVANGKPVIMTEFSTAACGGFTGVSDTFGAVLWGVDYSLQLATVGYSGAYLHTRERNITYNLYDYPGDGVDGWTTLPMFYSYLPVLNALQSRNGSKVVDLNLEDSMTKTGGTNAAYSIYDVTTSELYRLAFINFADGGGSVQYTIPQGTLPQTGYNVTVRYLTAPSIQEKWDITWGGKTWRGVKDGKPLNAATGQDLSLDCSSGCTVDVPNPGLALVLVNKALPQGMSSSGGKNGAGGGVVAFASIFAAVSSVFSFQVFSAFL